jgi:hypothetical protein
MVSGATGSAKHVIADFLKGENFEVINDNLVIETPVFNFNNELRLMMSRVRNQIVASSKMSRSNVVTIRSLWDHFEVIIQSFLDLERITQEQYDLFKIVYDAYWDIIPPPSLVIVTRTKKASSLNRSALRGQIIDQDLLSSQIKLYDSFFDRIAVPTIEVSSDDSPEEIKRNLEFGLASVKASGLYAGTIWEKRFFRER